MKARTKKHRVHPVTHKEQLMPICYIVGAGEFYGSLTPLEDDLVIAADGGYETLSRLGIRCDLLLGDMDSLKAGIDRSENLERLLFPIEKDETDTHLAYLEGVRRGYRDFRIYGGVGGREDHTFANLSLLLYGKNQGSHITLVGNGYEAFVIKNEAVRLSGGEGATLSVFAFGGDAFGVDILGAKYEARDVTLTPDFPLGVSNSFLSCEVEVSVRCGALLIMRET